MEMLLTILHYLAWEWLGISLEYTAGRWACLPHFFWAAVGVNLATHPLFTILLHTVSSDLLFVLVCEVVICPVEWGLLCVIYRRQPRLRLLAVSATMNVTSFVISLFL